MKDSKGIFPFLKEADSIALQQSLRHLDTAYRNFFRDRRAGFPGFKSRKKSCASYTTVNQNGTVAVGNGSIRLPKAGEVRAVIHRPLPADGRITSATVSMERDGTYYCSVLCEYDAAPIAGNTVSPDGVLGLDYKSDGLYADSDGNAADMPHYYRLAEKRLSRANRGGTLIRVGRLFPSSQLCQCGYQNPITKDLNIRTVTCPNCGRTYDRDINAALNIKKEGCRIFLSEHPAAV